jgi:hypothetical protein
MDTRACSLVRPRLRRRSAVAGRARNKRTHAHASASRLRHTTAGHRHPGAASAPPGHERSPTRAPAGSPPGFFLDTTALSPSPHLRDAHQLVGDVHVEVVQQPLQLLPGRHLRDGRQREGAAAAVAHRLRKGGFPEAMEGDSARLLPACLRPESYRLCPQSDSALAPRAAAPSCGRPRRAGRSWRRRCPGSRAPPSRAGRSCDRTAVRTHTSARTQGERRRAAMELCCGPDPILLCAAVSRSRAGRGTQPAALTGRA